MYEQFVGQGAVCTFHTIGMYFYTSNFANLWVFVDTDYPYTHEEIQEKIHNGEVSLKGLYFFFD